MTTTPFTPAGSDANLVSTTQKQEGLARYMTWFKVHSAKIKTHRKFRTLPNCALGAWLRIRAEVDLLEGEALPDLQYAIDLAQGDKESVETLIDVGLLDEDSEDGTIHIHDLADWGRAGNHTMPSDTPEARTERSRRHRERKRAERAAATSATGATTPATGATGATTEEKRVEEKRVDQDARAGAREDVDDDGVVTSSPGPAPWNNDDPNDPVDVWFRLTGRFPKDGAKEWMVRLMRDFGGGRRVVACMLEAYGADTDLSTLIGRTEQLLKMTAHRRETVEDAELRAAVTGPAREQSPEERAAIEERNRIAARESRKALLRQGLVQPTRPGDEELLAEPDTQASEVHLSEAGAALAGGTH